MKLHLGCGQQYFEGYVNIDFPSSEHTVQTDLKADVYSDIITLDYPICSIDEIRLHHVFEHFSRPIALALLCRWREWLKPGGLLRIETPDAMASFKILSSLFVSYDSKQQVMRHLFGSHEAGWAIHWDGWYRKKFEFTLKTLGFANLIFDTNKWGKLRNIEVFATKSNKKMEFKDYFDSIKILLTSSTVRVKTTNKYIPEGSELDMLDVWLKMWEEAYCFNRDVGVSAGLLEAAAGLHLNDS